MLLEEHKPDVVVHIGLAVERTHFAIEKAAERDGYNQYLDNDRKVFNKSEIKKAQCVKKIIKVINYI
jgi:pyrrolidone-carboxylate peptidase